MVEKKDAIEVKEGSAPVGACKIGVVEATWWDAKRRGPRAVKCGLHGLEHRRQELSLALLLLVPYDNPPMPVN